MKLTITRLAAALVTSGFVAGCGDPPVETSTWTPPKKTATPAGSALAGDGGLAAGPAHGGTDYTENDFVESERNRDPFRGYIAAEKATTVQITNQRSVKLSEYSVDELKLIGVVLAGDMPRAMFLDPKGKGHVLYKGDYMAKPEIVHTGGANGTDYQLNWRIDKIRETVVDCPTGDDTDPMSGKKRVCTRFEVVLIREDPTNVTSPAPPRIIPVHPEQGGDKAG